MHRWRRMAVPTLRSALPSLIALLGQTCLAATTMPLAPGTIVDHPLAGGGADTWTISMAASRAARLTVMPNGIAVMVEVLGPSANPLAVFEASARQSITLVAEAPGSYQIVVSAKYAHDAAAAYTIQSEPVAGIAPRDKALFHARTLSNKSHLEEEAGHYKESLSLARHALELAEPLEPADPFLGELYQKAGAAELLLGHRDDATAAFEHAIALEEATPAASLQLARALAGLGSVYIASSNYAKAEEVLQRALQLTQQNQGPESPAAAECLVTLATLHERRGDFDRALLEVQHALTIDQQRLEPDNRATLTALDTKGDIYFVLSDLGHAVPILQQTLRLSEKKLGPDHPFVAHPLQNLGSLARVQKQYPLALEYLWRAEKIRERALGIDNAATAGLLVNIGNVYLAQGDYPRSIDTFQRALAVLEKTAGPYHEWTMMTLGNLARAYAGQGDAANAVLYTARMTAATESNLSNNLAIGSEHERLAYAKRFAYQTSRVISLNVAVAPENPDATNLAAQLILQRKGRALDAVAGSMSDLRRHLDPEDQKLLNQLSGTLAELARAALSGPQQLSAEDYERSLLALQRQKETLETEISRRSAGYYQPSDAVTLATVRAAIPEDSLLLEFAVYQPYDYHHSIAAGEVDVPSRYVVYVIPPKGSSAEVTFKDLGDAKTIDDRLDAYRQTLRDPKRADSRQLARALDALLMQPLRSMDIAGKHLILSPDGDLNLLPFESLLDEQGRYLLETSSVSYVTAGRDMLRMKFARSGRSEPVIFANPSFGTPSLEAGAEPSLKPINAVTAARSDTASPASVYFAPLAGTALEAKDLKALFPEARVVTGSAATKSELEQVDSPSILHIATHGFFLDDRKQNTHQTVLLESIGSAHGIKTGLDTENPLLRSGLALAGANSAIDGSEHGILTALEASNLNLWGTKLVTLSACDTGVGEVRDGEGVYGLRRAFFIAGAETIVMSLWPVSDAITRALMTTYYRGLKEGLGRGEALRQAQLSMLNQKNHENPFYWASFIQVGDWTNLQGKP